MTEAAKFVKQFMDAYLAARQREYEKAEAKKEYGKAAEIMKHKCFVRDFGYELLNAMTGLQ